KTAAVLESMGKLETALKALYERRESVLAQKAIMPADSLRETKGILDRLNEATGTNRVQFRINLRQQIKQLIKRIDCKIAKNGWNTYLYAGINFMTGQKRNIFIWSRRGALKLVVADAEKWKGARPGDEILSGPVADEP